MPIAKLLSVISLWFAFPAYGCTELFRMLIREVHRPAFDWSAHLPKEGKTFKEAQADGMRYLVDLRSRGLPSMDPKKRDIALKTIDSFFDEVIKGYPEKVQARLRSIYHGGTDQTYTPSLFTKSNKIANWHFRQDETGAIRFTVEFDAAYRDAEIIKKLFLIHECAVHIGQVDQRLGQVGAEKMVEEFSTADPYLFTEMSAALAEKTLMSALDYSVLEADAGNITDPVTKWGILGQLHVMRNIDPKEYVELTHRGERIAPSASQISEFMKR